MLMKRNIAKSLLCVVLAMALLSGCGLGSYQTNPGQLGDDPTREPTENVPTGTTDPKPSTGEDTPYTVRLLHDNAAFVTGDSEINVVWHGQSGDYVYPLEADGTASAGVLDGDFDIYLTGLPDGYSYNPNIYHASDDSRHVDIIIVDILTAKGDGGISASGNLGLYTKYGCYDVTLQGTYRVTCYEPGQVFYFEYTPTAGGVYSIESWCNIYEDEVNPLIDIYTGNSAAKYYSETLDEGGAALAGGYTKNFRYEISMKDKNVGASYTFGIHAYSKTGEYPVTVEFAITYEGPPAEDASVYVDYKDVLNNVDKADNYTGESWNWADLGTKTFALNCKLDEDGYYRLYDEERYADANGWGPRILCQLAQLTAPCYPTTTIYDANKVGGSANNYLRLRVQDKETNELILYDYTDFIRKGYYKKINRDGRCYVTEELREFLQLYAMRHSLWTDNAGVTEGTPEDLEYSANQDDMWQFACGFYENGR